MKFIVKSFSSSVADILALMDILLKEFIDHKNQCIKIGRKPPFYTISPVKLNEKPEIEQFMYTIGS